MGRIYNFNPGPSTLPLSALEKAQTEFTDYKGSGMSVLEISHRSKDFEAILADTQNLLKELRTEQEWSQAELAEKLGVSRQTVNAIETGKYDPSLPLAFKIAK